MSDQGYYPSGPNTQMPPPYAQCVTMEDEQNQQMRTDDKAGLVPGGAHQGNPPPYPAQVGPIATQQWPAGGGYAGPVQQMPPNGQNAPPTVVVQRRQVVVCTRRDNFWQTYVKVRLAICCGILIVKVVVIAIVLAIVLGSSSSDDYDDNY